MNVVSLAYFTRTVSFPAALRSEEYLAYSTGPMFTILCVIICVLETLAPKLLL